MALPYNIALCKTLCGARIGPLPSGISLTGREMSLATKEAVQHESWGRKFLGIQIYKSHPKSEHRAHK